MKKSPAILMAAIAIATLSTACTSYKNPLPIPKNLKADGGLVGTWRSVDRVGDDNSYLQISVFPRPSGWIDIVIIDGIGRESSEGINVSTYEGFSTYVGNKRVLCIRGGETDGKKKRADEHDYCLVHYDLAKDGILSIDPLDHNAIENMIKEGTLKGKIERNGLGYFTITVTSSSEELAKALADKGLDSVLSDEPLLKLEKITRERH